MHDKNLLSSSSSAHISQITLFCRGTILSGGSQHGNIQTLENAHSIHRPPSECGEKLQLVWRGHPWDLCLGIPSGSKCRSAEVCRGWEQSLLTPSPPHNLTHTVKKELVQVIPDFLEGVKGKKNVSEGQDPKPGWFTQQPNEYESLAASSIQA